MEDNHSLGSSIHSSLHSYIYCELDKYDERRNERVRNKQYKKKVLISIVAFVVLLVMVGSIFFFYVTGVERIEVKYGAFFDDSGNKIGLCTIESKLNYLADVPEYSIQYYDLNKNIIGICEGDGLSCTVSSNQEPTICEPLTLQKPCDKSIYSAKFGSTVKYECVIS